MTTYPALEPASRVISFGDYPQLVHEGSAGVPVKFLQGSDRISQQLTLGYTYLSEAEMYQIINHYNGEEGTLLAFDLPSAVWAGFTTPPISSSYEWRYASAPSIELASSITYNVSVELISTMEAP